LGYLREYSAGKSINGGIYVVFSSITFLFVFLPIFLVGYYILAPQFKNLFLLCASLFFYWWGEPKFVLIMLASIALNYCCGLLCGCLKNEKSAKLSLFVAVLTNLGLLFVFKYLDFAITTVNNLFSTGIPLKGIALPIGISFFTFQGLSYVIDVYRHKVSPQKNPLKLGMYISMFPQLIAGPIVRYVDVEDQLSRRGVKLDNFYEGIMRFVTGLAKKVVISNTLALPVDEIFAVAPQNISFDVAWLGAIMYLFQIYFDFSGYSDMAIGLGKMIGFSFMENFNYPYMSKTVTEFWRRWHISLSTWFRDYVYIPLGGNRKGNVYLHLLTVFFLTGLWHGASWNFIVWGMWHGMFLIIERLLKKRYASKEPESGDNVLKSVLKWGYTLMVVLIGWVFFRADNLTYALDYIRAMFGLIPDCVPYFGITYYLDKFNVFILVLAALLSMNYIQTAAKNIKQRARLAGDIAERGLVIGLTFVCAVMTMAQTYNPFIYFRF